MKKVMFFLLCVLMVQLASASLGISPAKQYIDFKPGLEVEYSFNVIADSDMKLTLYSTGEFSDLVKFDKTELEGPGSFKVNIRLPDKIEIPGKHIILIGAKEKPDEDAPVGTSLIIQAPIVIVVPYPGKYAELTFYSTNANVNGLVKFELEIFNKGTELINTVSGIDIYNSEGKVETIYLGGKDIENQQSKKYIRYWNTSSSLPGDYEAIANVDYGARVAKANSKFRIGFLSVNITNYTREIITGAIRPFKIEVESLWNDPIENLYGEVYISKNQQNITNFLTPSISLKGWEKKTITGYLDAEKLELGEYDIKIKINYYSNFSISEGKLTIKKESSPILLYMIISIVVVLAVIAILIFFKIKSRKLKHERKK